MAQTNRIYKGWGIVGASFLIYLVVWGGVWYSFSVFLNIFVRDFHWGKGATSAVFSISAGLVFLTGPFVGKLLDILGPKRLMSLGAIALGVCLFLCSRMSSLVEFYLFYGLGCGLSMSLLLFTVQAAVVSRWFQAHRGTALGLGLSGAGIGMMTLVPLVQWITTRYGWQSGFILLAILVVTIVLPVTLQFVRFPQTGETDLEEGIPFLSQFRGRRRDRIRFLTLDHEWAATLWTPEQAIRTRRFWYVCIAGLIGNVSVIQTTFSHFVLIGTQAGYSATSSARMLGFAGIVGTAGFLFWGRLSDRVTREWAYTLGAGCLLASFLCFFLMKNSGEILLLFLFALFFGFGYGSRAPLAMGICADLFQGPSFPVIYGMYQMTLLLGMISPWIAGVIVDALGSYDAVIMGMSGSLFLSCLLIWLAAPRRVRRVIRQE